MKRNADITPIITSALTEVIAHYLQFGVIRDPGLFGLPDFSASTLLENAFSRQGDEAFCLYEKDFRIAQRRTRIALKIYFVDNVLSSNGLEVHGAHLLTELENLGSRLATIKYIKSIRLMIDEGEEYGSLIINGQLNITFGKYSRANRNGHYFLTGVATDRGFTPEWEKKSLSTHSAELMSREMPIPRKETTCSNKALANLVKWLRENFPELVSFKP